MSTNPRRWPPPLDSPERFQRYARAGIVSTMLAEHDNPTGTAPLYRSAFRDVMASDYPARPPEGPEPERPGRATSWTPDDDLSPRQLAAMDRLWRAQRYDGVPDDTAAGIEAQVRAGDLWHASRALAAARREATR